MNSHRGVFIIIIRAFHPVKLHVNSFWANGGKTNVILFLGLILFSIQNSLNQENTTLDGTGDHSK